MFKHLLKFIIVYFILFSIISNQLKDIFCFKKFKIDQNRSAMKIGTDGVLLGAWASLSHQPASILDIGAGTGLIALMLAQRSSAEIIDALEIDADAYEQCVENFEASLWGDRLYGYHAGLDEFVAEIDVQYDLIVSNPPFYAESVSSGSVPRDTARQNKSLPFTKLLAGVASLMAPNGRFAVIIPFKEENSFMNEAKRMQLYPNRILRVRGNPAAQIKRSLLEFSRLELEMVFDELIIESRRHVYTKEYRDLTKEFYLKM